MTLKALMTRSETVNPHVVAFCNMFASLVPHVFLAGKESPMQNKARKRSRHPNN